MAAPARAAAMADSAISSGVTGRYGDMDGVWMAPVMAQLIMARLLLLEDMGSPSLVCPSNYFASDIVARGTSDCPAKRRAGVEIPSTPFLAVRPEWLSGWLKEDRDRDPDAGVRAIIQVVAIVGVLD